MALQFYSYEAMLRKLAPYECRRTAVFGAGFETWKSGWGAEFTLAREPDGTYAAFQYLRALQVLHYSKPSDGLKRAAEHWAAADPAPDGSAPRLDSPPPLR